MTAFVAFNYVEYAMKYINSFDFFRISDYYSQFVKDSSDLFTHILGTVSHGDEATFCETNLYQMTTATKIETTH